jgi:hypothetical protein
VRNPARASALALVSVALATAVAGCMGVETTQDKSARIARDSRTQLAKQTAVKIGPINHKVTIVSRDVVQDPTGVAVVVTLVNHGPTAIDAPVGLTVLGAAGKQLYTNDVPGLDKSLTSVPVLQKGRSAVWVDNQVTAVGKARTANFSIGQGHPAPAGKLPEITLSKITVGSDADGAFAKGIVANRSPVEQRRLTIYCVARKGKTVTAAGRAVVDKLPPRGASKKPTRFTAFFIGKPKGAAIRCEAPPVQLTGASQ